MGNSSPSLVISFKRNSYGDFVFAKGGRLPDTMNLVAEATTFREDSTYYTDKNLNNVIIESGPLLLVQIIRGVW